MILLIAIVLQILYRLLLYPLVSLAQASVRSDFPTVYTLLITRPLRFMRYRSAEYAYLLYLSDMKAESTEVLTFYSIPPVNPERYYIQTVESARQQDWIQATNSLGEIEKLSVSVPCLFIKDMQQIVSLKISSEADLQQILQREKSEILRYQKTLSFAPLVNTLGTLILIVFAYIFGYVIE